MRLSDYELDAIYTFCDLLIRHNNIEMLDWICSKWPIEDSSPTNLDEILGLLTATLRVKKRLPSRSVLLKRAILVYGNDDRKFNGL